MHHHTYLSYWAKAELPFAETLIAKSAGDLPDEDKVFANANRGGSR